MNSERRKRSNHTKEPHTCFCLKNLTFGHTKSKVAQNVCVHIYDGNRSVNIYTQKKEKKRHHYKEEILNLMEKRNIIVHTPYILIHNLLHCIPIHLTQMALTSILERIESCLRIP